MRDIGKNIRDLREAAGLKQEELAEKLFVTRQTVSNYETGKTRPDVEMIGALAEVLGTDANTVFYGPTDSAARRRQRQKLLLWGGILALLAPVILCLPIPAWRPLQYFTLLVMAHPAIFAIPGAVLALLSEK